MFCSLESSDSRTVFRTRIGLSNMCIPPAAHTAIAILIPCVLYKSSFVEVSNGSQRKTLSGGVTILKLCTVLRCRPRYHMIPINPFFNIVT